MTVAEVEEGERPRKVVSEVAKVDVRCVVVLWEGRGEC